MFLVFLTGVVPKEYIHDLFYDHHDEAHPVYKKGEIVFTSKHNHCSFLGFVFAPYVATEQQHITFTTHLEHKEHYTAFYSYHFEQVYTVPSLRGPPVLC